MSPPRWSAHCWPLTTLTLAVAQNNELVEQLATADADAESDMSILHRRIVATDARNEELERQWAELTAELKQFAGAIDSMAASENVAAQDTPRLPRCCSA